MATLKERRKADRLRQKRWMEREKKKGNKAFTIMLTPEMQKILTDETKRTGRSKVEIVGQAILNLKIPTTKTPIMRGERPPEQQKIIQTIKALQEKGKNHSQIAKILNGDGIKPFSGGGKWWPATVRKLFIAEDKSG